MSLAVTNVSFVMARITDDAEETNARQPLRTIIDPMTNTWFELYPDGTAEPVSIDPQTGKRLRLIRVLFKEKRFVHDEVTYYVWLENGIWRWQI
jgi:hypothetical protein